MQTLIIYFSDIHLSDGNAEGEGLVVQAFVKDVKEKLKSIPHDDVFAFIGGDLVQAADSYDSYILFDKMIVKPLAAIGIPQSHIYCVPGNHDVQRGWINQNKALYAPFVSQEFKESEFNDIAQDEKQSFLLKDKFDNFSSFAESCLNIPSYNPFGFHTEIGENWSLYCLNTSLISFGGLKYDKYPQLIDDKGHITVYTRDLYDWIEHNQKRKILMMHHPFDFLREDTATELRKIVKTKIDLLLTGHTHDQDILCNVNGPDSFVWCRAPQLYTSKSDDLGYCIIKINDDSLDKIIYREWFTKRNAFKPGLNFTDSDDGVVQIPQRKDEVIDKTSVQFEEIYKDVMAVYNGQPVKWIERFFSTQRFDRSFRYDYKGLITEEQILESNKSFKIIAPSQYGLTTFGWHFIYKKMWQQKKEFGLFLDAGLIRNGNISKLINKQLTKFEKTPNDVKRIIIDNWNLSEKTAKATLSALQLEFAEIPIIILCPQLETTLVGNEYVSVTEFGFNTLFMAPMRMGQMRALVELYSSVKHLGQDTDVVMKKLNDDIVDFNMHRSPLNCITLLEVFCNSFDDNPVNRTSLLEKILRIIFDNEKVPTYRSLPDVKDCEFILGYYCEQMILNNHYYFKNEDFTKDVLDFCKKQKLTVDVNYLFEVLLRNNIICQYDTNMYGFRFAYWVYYFAAMRMTKSPEFASYILSNKNYVHYSEIIEFYTGSDRNRNDAVDIVTNDISEVSDKVHDKVGIIDGFNPFEHLKLQRTDDQVDKTLQQLDDNLKRSKLPNDIKDALADKDYNPSKPYHQSVYKVFENYSVNNLQQMIGIASKTLRNSDYVLPEKKERLIKAITNAWLNIVRVITLMAPALSKEGHAKYEGFSLVLADGFENYEKDPKGTLIKVITSIPDNIIRWYKDDIFSSKLTQLFYDTLPSEPNPIIRHLLISLIIYERPVGWTDVVLKYLETVGYNSYYFGDALNSLEFVYRFVGMSDADVSRTKNLIMLAYTKQSSSDHKIHRDFLSNTRRYKFNLPERENGNEKGGQDE